MIKGKKGRVTPNERYAPQVLALVVSESSQSTCIPPLWH